MEILFDILVTIWAFYGLAVSLICTAESMFRASHSMRYSKKQKIRLSVLFIIFFPISLVIPVILLVIAYFCKVAFLLFEFLTGTIFKEEDL